MKNLTLVIPAKDEPNCLPKVLEEIKNYDCKKIIVIDKEDKKTFEAIKEFEVQVLFQTGKGYGNAIIEGMKEVNTEYLGIFYADGSTDPKYLSEMINKIEKENLSIIFCSRYEKGGGSDDDDIITRIGNFLFTFIGNILFSLKISDILFTYFVAKKNEIEKLKLKSNDYCLCVEIPIKCKINNYKYKTIPCFERKRFADKKKVKPFRVGFSILIYIFKYFLKLNFINQK